MNYFFYSLKRTAFKTGTILLCISGSAFAQTGTSSPYSRFGLGELQDRGFVHNLTMGGTGIGIANPHAVNILNPASAASLELTTFDAGLYYNSVKYTNPKLSQRVGTAAPGYFSIAFPLGKKAGIAAGLTPYTNVGYHVTSSTRPGYPDYVNYSYEGLGGINRFFLNPALKLSEHFRLGLTVSYLFGSIIKQRSIEFPDTSFFFNTRFRSQIRFSDISFNYGIQYTRKVKKDYTLVLGLSAANSTKLSIKNEELITRYSKSIAGYETVKDTLPSSGSKDQSVTLPLQYGVGASLAGRTWMLALDASFQNWSDYKGISDDDENLKNSSSINIGGQWQPNPGAINSMFKIARYRAGLHYSSTYLQVNNAAISERGFSVGFGLPLPRAISLINIGFEMGVRSANNVDVIRQDYYKLMFGFTFNDKWFIRRKLD